METKERIEPVVVEQPDPAPTPGSLLQHVRARITQHIRFHPREAGALAVLGLLLLIGAGLAYMRARPAAAVAPPSGAVSASASPGTSAAPANTIVVDVVGAVRKPGVYDFAQGARVIDAVRAAGGFLPDAEPQAINLARPLVDGEQVVVPRKGETPAGAAGGGSAQQPGGKVNINSATESDFENLPGIGPVLAQKIVDYRDQHGPFRSIQDLMKVTGIGQKKFDSLSAYVTV
ncbi:MAG TPA: helix-hairpin-helix domain-containing protein [Actinomycetota bacterium]|nr:helix-hairpin-helix domain-containing protein [Actinomycetota bacterium]